MQGITQKEKIELEEVFAAIYTKKESKILRFYKEFYSVTILNLRNIKTKIKRKTRKFNV
ncbi:hypothetical protein CMCT_0666 [Campylobacter mucosalis]|uniref:Uncharacterized protein n=1 Tax=Campylobacter mucosalis CCUG 21559 TaxID=1032067 RepID=A0A6G5QHD0_9BACT|nr:hypothetical protein [Campylobacter mucosalis]QCD44906.1 hypothetical protein CMUC_1132 [Campylobacter mucosalis CCUG 21559]QKF62814.1 hypothetical protein CMCT_0666 [Campylobacter mucosalis]